MQRCGISRIINESRKLAFKGLFYTVHTLIGIHISLTTRYMEFSRISASFTAPIEMVQKILPSKKLKVVEYAPGITFVSFTASEMRQISLLEPYNEFGICIPVRYETAESGAAIPGIFVFSMPVTTEEARWGGVEIYGYPKFIAEITFNDQGKVRSCQVRASDRSIINLEVTKLETEYLEKDEYYYTVRDKQLIRSLFTVKGQFGTTDLLGGAYFTLGDHPIVDELRELSIEGISIRHEYVSYVEGVLHKPSKPLKL